MVSTTLAVVVLVSLLCGFATVLVFELYRDGAHGDKQQNSNSNSNAPKDFFSASIEFCEPNYAISPHIAEFYNTLSSLGIALIAAIGLHRAATAQHPAAFLSAFFFLFLTGLGSAWFHARLSLPGQAMDELGMMLVIINLVYIAQTITKEQRHFGFYVTLFGLSFVVYWVFRSNPAPFQAMFISGVLYVVLHTLRLRNTCPVAAKVGLERAFFTFSISAFLWLLEPIVCEYLPTFIQFHSIWHIGSAMGMTFWLDYALRSLPLELPE